MRTLLIMAGGTGGHVFPALAVAHDLRDRGVEVVWLGTHSGIEARAVPAAGFDMEWVTIRGVRGKGIWGLLQMPVLVAVAMLQTLGVVLRRRPNALLGMGGFVAGPGGFVAWLLRRPLLIHEANAIAGLTNRLLAHLAQRVMVGFEGTFPEASRAECVGNPVRPEIAGIPEPERRLAGRPNRLRILVVGGSQGARVLNQVLPVAIAGLDVASVPEIWHQSGRDYATPVETAYRTAGIDARVSEFIDDMASAYTWADLVVCRAGAMTVAEVSAAGVAALFVPFPHAVGDHQSANARYLVERGAALMLRETELTAERLCTVFEELRTDRRRIQKMSCRARQLGRPDATSRVADICMEVLSA